MSSNRAVWFAVVLGLTFSASLPALAQDAAEPAPAPAEPAVEPAPAETAPAPAPAQAAEPAAAPAAAPAYETEASLDVNEAAMDEDLHRVGIFASPLSLIFGQLPVELDIRVARTLTLNAQFQYVKSGDFSGVGFAGGPQWFFTDKAFHGGYLFPTFQYASISGAGVDATGVGVGATVGYQWLWGAFGLRLGGGFVYYSVSASDSATAVSLEGVSPALDLSLGVSF